MGLRAGHPILTVSSLASPQRAHRTPENTLSHRTQVQNQWARTGAYFFTDLNASVVHLASMPTELLKAPASRLDVHIQDVISGMQQGDGHAVAMKSDAKPGAEAPIEFADYVDHADLTEEEQRALHTLFADDGSD